MATAWWERGSYSLGVSFGSASCREAVTLHFTSLGGNSAAPLSASAAGTRLVQPKRVQRLVVPGALRRAHVDVAPPLPPRRLRAARMLAPRLLLDDLLAQLGLAAYSLKPTPSRA